MESMLTNLSHGTAPPVPDVDAFAVAELIDKQKLYENMALYCRGQDRKDLELMKSTFWPEATDNHGMWFGSAHDFCEWAYENQKISKHRSQHYITNVLIELDGEVARRETAVIYAMVRPDRPTDVLGARYRDLCERRNGEWRVLRRVLILDHVTQAPATEFAAIYGDLPATARLGDVHPNDPIFDEEW
jgi:hypothetical protein